jgi:hypothetical protein
MDGLDKSFESTTQSSDKIDEVIADADDLLARTDSDEDTEEVTP